MKVLGIWGFCFSEGFLFCVATTWSVKSSKLSPKAAFSFETKVTCAGLK